MSPDQKEISEIIETFSDVTCEKVQSMMEFHFKNVMGVDIHDQRCVNEFNNMIKNMFEIHKTRVDTKGAFLKAFTDKIVTAMVFIFSLGLYHFFIGG